MSRSRLWTASFAAAASTLLSPPYSVGQATSAPRVQAIRYWSFGNVTRVAIQTDGGYRLKFDQIQSPPRLYFDLDGLRPPTAAQHGFETIQVGDRLVKQIRVAEVGTLTTRVVFDLATSVEVVSSQLVNPDRLMIEVRPKGTGLTALSVARSVTGSRQSDALQQSRTPLPEQYGRPAGLTVTSPKAVPPPIQVLPTSSHTATSTAASNMPKSTAPAVIDAPIPPPPVAVPSPTSVSPPNMGIGDRSLVRVFGLKLGKVVIDAGHGGHDTGTIGLNGLLEKDLVLDVALRLGSLIKSQLGADVVYTRADDTFVRLEDRTRVANEQKADLFISIHANSSSAPSATGVETYYFNFTSDKTSLDLATRENATSGSSISDLNDLLHRAVLQTKLEESRQFAQGVQTSLSFMSAKMNGKSKDRGVRQAPFVVLIGATMPSILAEVGFVSNPHDEKLMQRSDQRQKIAESLFKGVAVYASSLSHMQMARANGQ